MDKARKEGRSGDGCFKGRKKRKSQNVSWQREWGWGGAYSQAPGDGGHTADPQKQLPLRSCRFVSCQLTPWERKSRRPDDLWWGWGVAGRVSPAQLSCLPHLFLLCPTSSCYSKQGPWT